MIIYPSNIDSSLTKKEGRKVSRKHGVPSPTAKELLKAAHALGGMKADIEEKSSYPRRPWAVEGRLVVEEKGGKRLVMKRVSKEIKRMRSSSEPEA